MKRGFTLLEVVIALLIVGILATGLLPALASLTKASLNSELIYAAPGVAQTKIETNKEEEENNVYLDKFGIKTNSASINLDGLQVSTVTVETGESGYSYSLSAIKDMTTEETKNYSLQSESRVDEISTTPTTSATGNESPNSTIWTQKTCTSSLVGDAHDDTVVYGDQYMEVRAGNDDIISYALTFWVPSASNNDNYIIIAIPGNTDSDDQHSKPKDKEYSYVAFEYKHMNDGEPPSLKGACQIKNGTNGNPDWLPSTSTTVKGLGEGGSFLFPKGLSSATVVYQYTLSAHVVSKAAWNLSLSIKFLPGTPTSNQWVRIYIPGSSGEVTTEIPATTEEVTVTNTFYEPFTFPVYQPRVDGLIAWDSITFDLSENASVTVEVKTDSMSSPYVFHATGPATQVKISIGQYDLPVDEGFKIWFTVAPIDNTKPATVNNVQVSYWTAATSP